MEKNEIQEGLKDDLALGKGSLFPFGLSLPGLGECSVDVDLCVRADGGEVATRRGVVADDMVGASRILSSCDSTRYIRINRRHPTSVLLQIHVSLS